MGRAGWAVASAVPTGDRLYTGFRVRPIRLESSRTESRRLEPIRLEPIRLDSVRVSAKPIPSLNAWSR